MPFLVPLLLAAPAVGGGSSPPLEEETAGDAVEWNLYADLFGRKDTKAVFVDGAEVSDFGRVRHVDLEAYAPVAELVRAAILVSLRSSATNTEYSVELEEGYLELDVLPLVPLGAKAGVGVFRAHFGAAQRWRVHELPFVVRPRSIANFFGEESYSQLGAWTQIDALALDAGMLRLYADYLDSGEPPLTEDAGGSVGAQVLRGEWVSTPGRPFAVEGGVSWLRGQLADLSTRRVDLVGADVLVTRRWGAAGGSHAVTVGAEYLEGSFDRAAGEDAEPAGHYAWAQYENSGRWRAGVYWDVAQELVPGEPETTTGGVFAGFSASPSLRVSVAVERSDSEIPILDDVTRAFGQVTLALGEGPRPPFWRR